MNDSMPLGAKGLNVCLTGVRTFLMEPFDGGFTYVQRMD